MLWPHAHASERAPSLTYRGGQLLLAGTLALLLLLLVYFVWAAPDLVVGYPIALLGGALLYALGRRLDAFLYVALAGFVAISGNEAGIQIPEVAYGLVFLTFFGLWYTDRLYLAPRRLVRAPEDGALALFLLFAGLSTTWAVGFGAETADIVGEALTLIMLAFYFPVKEICARKGERAVRVLLVIVAWYGVFATIRNLLIYRSALHSAEHLWEIATGRVALNEVLLMVPSLGAMTLLLYARRWWQRLLLVAAFLLYFSGLIITQSRGYWAAFLLGAVALFILTDRRRKGTILLLASGGLIGFLGIGSLLFPNLIPLILGGIVERFATLGSALTSDLSLVNRFYETAAVWEHIKVNPLIGYGMGTEYSYYNLTVDRTRVWAFVHNGYAGLWYKFGLIGLALMLTFWIRSLVLGVRLFRHTGASRGLRVAGLIAAIALLGELLVANTSNPFLTADATLTITLLAAIASGGLEHAQHAPPREAPAPSS